MICPRENELQVPDLLEAALEYARLGYPVFPCKPGRKDPLTKHGLKDASTDEETIRRWWETNPRANIGLVTDGLLVVDIDGADNTWPGGEEGADLANAPTSLTPSGGRHHVFRQPAGKGWRNTASGLALKVDTRADGGYIVVSPSINGKNKAYQWVAGLELDMASKDLPEPPQWLVAELDDLAAGRGKKSDATNSAVSSNSILNGQRNATLTRLAGTMRRAGMEPESILAALNVENLAKCKPPMDASEVARIAKSVGRYEPAHVLNYECFPVQVFPECLRQFVETVSKSMLIDPSVVALPALSALAAAVGNSRRIRIKNGWVEPSILWTVVVAESGSTKSPPFNAVMEPLREWQDSGKARTLTSNATTESLHKVLSENPRGMILARNELSGWFGSFGEYKSGKFGDVSTWLELFEGKPTYIDRVGNGSLKIPKSTVSLSGTIQPAILATVLKPEFRDNGLLARFLLASPPDQSKFWTEDDIPDSANHEWRDLVWCLLDITGEDELPMAPDGKRLFVDFFDRYHKEREALPITASDMKAAYPKLIAYAARIALVLQMVRHAGEGGRSDIIEAESMAASIKLVEWFKNETMRVYGLLDGAKNKAQDDSLLGFIKRKGGRLTVREVQQGYRPFKESTADQVENALLELARNGHGRIESEGKSTIFTLGL